MVFSRSGRPKDPCLFALRRGVEPSHDGFYRAQCLSVGKLHHHECGAEHACFGFAGDMLLPVKLYTEKH